MATYNDHRHTRRGSFGLVVKDLEREEGDEDDLLILTAAHLFEQHPEDARVAYCEPGPEPAPASGDHASKHCGVVRRKVPLHLISYVAVDAAVIKPPAGLKYSNELAGTKIAGIHDLWPEPDETEVKVRKIGAQSGETCGRLMPVAADQRMKGIPARYSLGWWVDGEAAAFADSGDSGSIVVDDQGRAVGMCVAVEHDGTANGGPPATFVHGIKQIFHALNITLP